MKARFIGLVLALAPLAAACANPAVDARIEELGEEPNPDLTDFQYHRAGQPCVLCHGEYEEEEPIMSVGGTIFQTRQKRIPVDGAVVRVWDSSGEAARTTTTNCVGNFWFPKEEWDPLFPLHVEVEYTVLVDGNPTKKIQPMAGRIGRDGSCAACHADSKPTQGTPGRVFCTADETAAFPSIPADCPIQPDVVTPPEGT